MPEDINEQDKQIIEDNKSMIAEQVTSYVYRFFWLINFIIIIAILALGYYFMLLPMYQKITSNQEIGQKREEYLQSAEYLKQLKELNKFYQGVNQNDKNKINKIVDSNNDSSELMLDVDYMIFEYNRFGMKAKTFNTTPLDKQFQLSELANKKGGSYRNNVSIAKSKVVIENASYLGLVGLLKKMELNLRIMDVVAVLYNPKEKVAEIEFITYQQPKR